MAYLHSNPTFRIYIYSQAKLYVAGRRHADLPALYEPIFLYHTETGGQFHALLDVRRGPDSATRKLVGAFDVAQGVDPSVQMTAMAREGTGRTRIGREVLFEVYLLRNVLL